MNGVLRELVPLKKGEPCIAQAACGPLSRQRGLARTKSVEDLITAAFVAADDRTSEDVDKLARVVAFQPRDPMPDFS